MATATPDLANDQVVSVLPRWHVVLLDDDEHSYDYVVEMVMHVFRKEFDAAYAHAVEVDTAKRTILDTTTRERAELKRQQVHDFGPDWRIAKSRSGMRAELEPAD